jgi:hypothetical protein
MTDTELNEQYVFSAGVSGPLPLLNGMLGIPKEGLYVQAGETFLPFSPENENGGGWIMVQDLGTYDISGEEMSERFREFNGKWNAEKHPYDSLDQNSNTYVSESGDSVLDESIENNTLLPAWGLRTNLPNIPMSSPPPQRSEEPKEEAGSKTWRPCTGSRLCK